jgi:nucleotide-binding universal stress UspA family protein
MNEPTTALQNTGEEPEVIAVAVDSSLSAGAVVSMAARLARALPSASVHVLHVFRTSRLERGHAWSSEATNDALADAKDHLEAQVRAARAQCRNSVSGHFLVGDPTAEILRVTAELLVDVLVIGTHDVAGLERLLLGSIAETLVRRAPCSVFVVRP